MNAVVATQSCDLAHGKSVPVLVCGVWTIGDLQRIGLPSGNDTLEAIRQGRRPPFHMLAAPANPGDNRQALIVDFRQVFTLNYNYATAHAAALGERHRLNPPYVEHFSQALARFFMRVGLPTDIPPFK